MARNPTHKAADEWLAREIYKHSSRVIRRSLSDFRFNYLRNRRAAARQATQGTNPMTTHTVNPEFAKTALLVSLNIRVYSAKKVDPKVTKKVAADNGTDSDAGNYQKNLVPKEAIEPITKAVSALRSFHTENSLPWLDEGVRCLPTMNYEAYKTELETLKDAFDTAVRDFCDKWPEIVDNAQKKLGKLFNANDYPQDIRGRFSCSTRFMPMSTSDDFRINVSDSEREILRQQIEGTVAGAQTAATADLYRRLGESVKAMADRLRAYTVDPVTGKTSAPFRDSLVENLRDLVALVPRLNFAEDAELEAVRVLVESELCAVDADGLRDSDTVRAGVAESAEGIAARLGEYMK